MWENIKNAYRTLESVSDRQFDIEMTPYQFYITGILMESHPFLFNYYVYYTTKYQPAVVFIIYLFATTLLAVPLNIVFLFSGSYTKMKVLRFWNCVPLFKGVGYTMLITRVILLTFSIVELVTTLQQFMYELNDRDFYESQRWETCNFTSDPSCLSMDELDPVNCKKGEVYIFSSLLFFSENILRMDAADTTSTLNTLIYCGIWFSYPVLLVIGMRKLLKPLLFVYFCTFTFRVVVFVILLFRAPASVSEIDSLSYLHDPVVNKYDFLWQIEFWVLTITSCSGSTEIPGIIWIGSLKPKKLRPHLPILAMFMVKIIFLLLNLVVYKSSWDYFVLETYSISQTCIQQGGFVILPDHRLASLMYKNMLLSFDLAKIWIFSFEIPEIILVYLDNIFTFFMIEDAIVDKFEGLKNKRVLFAILWCLFNCLISYPLTTRLKYFIYKTFQNVLVHYLSSILILIITLPFFYIYSVDMIKTDYIFLYAEKCRSMILVSCHLWPILGACLVVGCMYMGVFKLHNLDITESMHFWAICALAVLLLPVILFMIIEISHYIKGTSIPDRPNSSWGPPDDDDKLLRMLLIPQRNICYRHKSITCTHRCLAKTCFENEDFHQRVKIFKAVKNLNLSCPTII